MQSSLIIQPELIQSSVRTHSKFIQNSFRTRSSVIQRNSFHSDSFQKLWHSAEWHMNELWILNAELGSRWILNGMKSNRMNPYELILNAESGSHWIRIHSAWILNGMKSELTLSFRIESISGVHSELNQNTLVRSLFHSGFMRNPLIDNIEFI